MNWDTFVWGFLAGYVFSALMPVVRAILRNALRESACTQDCNQGRRCDCANKKE
jgi:hypothetical protein